MSGREVPAPVTSFAAANFTPEILEEVRPRCPRAYPSAVHVPARSNTGKFMQIKHAGFTEPSPIQAQAWPVAMEGRDLVAIAKTGSGKTCGFLLPGFMHIKSARNDPRNGPTVLVLAPTRELANQIQVEANKFGKYSGIRNTYVHITGSRAFVPAPRVSTCRSLVALANLPTLKCGGVWRQPWA